MGATAIEDKLQDGVPETIANLAKVSEEYSTKIGLSFFAFLLVYSYMKLVQ